MKTFMQVLLLAIPGLGKFTNLHSCVKFDFYLALKRSNAYKALFQLNQSMNPSLNVFINPLTPLTWYLTIHGPLSLLQRWRPCSPVYWPGTCSPTTGTGISA